ncbi:YqiJ family protein [Acinetobacter indicus]|uniref:YqiJ family protein n=1 Tax=Acinetobacter indicus TaxID=756892 RepID=UPI001443EF16|nr:YqiJ family protein [Acinetobacter indicus]
MWDLLTHPSNLIFSVCIYLLFFFALLEVFLLLAGGGSQGILDQFLPDDLIPHKDVEVNIDGSSGLLVQFLDWLYIGRVPLLIWLIIFLTLYGLSGLILQSVLFQWTGQYITAWIMAPACLFLSMPLVRYSAMLIARILPQDETTAIYSDELIGRTATIILGVATPNSPAEAKVQDQHGLTHYILVEPEQDESFQQGQSVILTGRTKIGFYAMHLN